MWVSSKLVKSRKDRKKEKEKKSKPNHVFCLRVRVVIYPRYNKSLPVGVRVDLHHWSHVVGAALVLAGSALLEICF